MITPSLSMMNSSGTWSGSSSCCARQGFYQDLLDVSSSTWQNN